MLRGCFAGLGGEEGGAVQLARRKQEPEGEDQSPFQGRVNICVTLLAGLCSIVPLTMCLC